MKVKPCAKAVCRVRPGAVVGASALSSKLIIFQLGQIIHLWNNKTKDLKIKQSPTYAGDWVILNFALLFLVFCSQGSMLFALLFR
jgi:hypothetical protein